MVSLLADCLHKLLILICFQISNADCLIANVRVCPGSSNDRWIWSTSSMKIYLESLQANMLNERYYYFIGKCSIKENLLSIIDDCLSFIYPVLNLEQLKQLYLGKSAKHGAKLSGYLVWLLVSLDQQREKTTL